MSITSGNGGNAGAERQRRRTAVSSSQPARPVAAARYRCRVSSATCPGTGSVVANGGNVFNHSLGVQPTPVMTGGRGGMGGTNGKGGNGGSAGDGPGTAILGGKITVTSATGISLADYEANGGSVIGAFDAVGGKGGDDIGGGVGDTGGGNGGAAENNGSGGNGGDISLTSHGDITVDTISATGGTVGDMSASGGKGGNQQTGRGKGGSGGSAGSNGNGGTGGKIDISTLLIGMTSSLGAVQATGNLDVDGGSVGVYSARSGDGGNAGPGGGAGGGAGRLGSNGIAGDGNEIKIVGSDGNLTFGANLLADGGSVAGPYTGIAGQGGDG